MKRIVLPVSGRTDETYELAPSKIICLALNYADHIKESVSVRVSGFTSDVPTEPVLFPKTPNALIGPGDNIELPAIVAKYGFEEPRTDHEAELAVVIGKAMKNVPAGQTMDYVYGYTCANDISQRNIQNLDRSGWYRGKSFDTFCPVGPVIVPRDAIDDPHNLAIYCRVGRRVTQEANTGRMIFRIPEILEYISHNMTLEAGDLVLTGTPSGVGPISPGDTVEVEVDQIGTLRNQVVAGE